MMRGNLQAMAALPSERASRKGTVARRLLGYLWPYWKQLLVVLGLVLIGAVTQAAGPFLIGRAIDGAIGKGDGKALDQTMLLLLGVYVVGALATRAQLGMMGVVGQQT